MQFKTYIYVFLLLWVQTTATSYFETGFYSVVSEKKSYYPNQSFTLTTRHDFKNSLGLYTFSDLRGKIDLSENSTLHEVNFGLAWRTNIGKNNRPIVIGNYSFIDITHIENNIYLKQHTYGLEYIDPYQSFRMNIYQPDKTYITHYKSSTLPFHINQGNKIITNTKKDGIVSIQAPKGIDSSLHVNLDQWIPCTNLQFGYQYFYAKDYETLKGPEIAIEFNINQQNKINVFRIFGKYDHIYGKTLGMRFQIRNLAKRSHKLHTLEKLYIQPIIRDIDIKLNFLPGPRQDTSFEEMKKHEIDMINALLNIQLLKTETDVNNKHENNAYIMLQDGIEFTSQDSVENFRSQLNKMKMKNLIDPIYYKKASEKELRRHIQHRHAWSLAQKSEKPITIIIEDEIEIKKDFYEYATRLIYEINNIKSDIIFTSLNTMEKNQNTNIVEIIENPINAYVTYTNKLARVKGNLVFINKDLYEQILYSNDISSEVKRF
ncbi:MAG: hypothetical protein VX112_05130 [Pseudomonadota bacterium]|nr:hypothetical protein [Pseudomonadota bacterium]